MAVLLHTEAGLYFMWWYRFPNNYLLMQRIISFRAPCWSVCSCVGEILPRCKSQYEDQFTANFSLGTVQYIGLAFQLNIYTTHCSSLPWYATPLGCPCDTGPEPQNVSMWKRQTNMAGCKEFFETWHRWLNSTAGGNKTSGRNAECCQRWEILTVVTVVQNRFYICCHQCLWKKPEFVRIMLT